MQPTCRVGVTVSFLRMDGRPEDPARPFPPGTTLVGVEACSVSFYRYLYDTVGGQYVWWLRRSLPDAAIRAILRDPCVSVTVLYQGGEPAGFFELDRHQGSVVNLSYFGLMPAATGIGLGGPFLRAAVDGAFALGAHSVTVNTCTADHSRALPGYLRAGFKVVRSMREIWDVPTRLGLAIPERLRI